MVVLAIGIELALMMAVDRLQHSHLRKDHRAAVFCRARFWGVTYVKKKQPQRWGFGDLGCAEAV
jgi:hypothetical protein